MHTDQPEKPRTGEKDETLWYFIDGKWITGDQREALIARNKLEISQIEEEITVCEHAQEAANDLVRLARDGKKLAVAVLFWITCDLVDALNSIATKQPELLLEISRGMPIWPAYISRKRAFKFHNAELMDTLQLGEGGPYSKREWQPQARSTQKAIALFVIAQFHRKDWDLPPLTEKNKRKWFEASWNYMLKEGIPPEQRHRPQPCSGWDSLRPAEG